MNDKSDTIMYRGIIIIGIHVKKKSHSNQHVAQDTPQTGKVLTIVQIKVNPQVQGHVPNAILLPRVNQTPQRS